MQKDASIDWVTHLELNWEFDPVVSKKKGNFCGPHLNLHAKWETIPYLLLSIWIKRCMDFGHLPTHVPNAMLNHFDGGKEEMSKL